MRKRAQHWKVKRAFCCPALEPKWRGPLWQISVFPSKSCSSAQDNSLSPAKRWDSGSREFMWSRGEARKQAKLFCSLLPLPPSSSPTPASPPSARLPAAPDVPVGSICLRCLVLGGSAISSHIAQIVSIRAGVNSSGFL